jgi:hypothetical protein
MSFSGLPMLYIQELQNQQKAPPRALDVMEMTPCSGGTLSWNIDDSTTGLGAVDSWLVSDDLSQM